MSSTELEMYILLIDSEVPNKYMLTGHEYKASNPLKAAKKAYRDNKSLETVCMYNINTRMVFVYSTKSFMTMKKPFQLER